MVKKVFAAMCICALASFPAFAKTTLGETPWQGLDLESAVLIPEGERADIYDIDLSEDLDADLFEDLSPASVELMAAKTYSVEFQSVTNTLDVANNVLKGSVTAVFSASEAVDGVLYLGIYDENDLTAVYIKDFNQGAGNYTHTFSDISAKVSSENYTFKLFMMDNNLTPLAEAYAFTPTITGTVFADGADVSPSEPIYYRNESILGDINVFSGVGAVLDYDSDNNVLWIRKNNVKIGMYVNDDVLYVFKGNNRYTVTCTNASFVQNSCIYVPITEICEVFGFEAVYDTDTKKTYLYSNEVIEAVRSSNFSTYADNPGYFSTIPTTNYYSAQINNGLTYFTAMGTHYIYVTNGSQTIKYDIGSDLYPSYILSEGDYIYYITGDRLMRLNKNTSLKTELKRITYSGFLTGLYYYNGEMYFDGAKEIYDIQNRRTAYDQGWLPSSDRKLSLIPLGRNLICDITAKDNYSKDITTVTVTILQRTPYKELSKREFSFDCSSSTMVRSLYAKHIGDSIYLKLYDVNKTQCAEVALNDSHEITDISAITTTALNKVWKYETNTQSNFAKTLAPNSYRFWQDEALIQAEERATGDIITVNDLKYRCNRLLFADDTCYIYCSMGITRLNRDGKTVYKYNGESVLYLVYYNGESTKLFST